MTFTQALARAATTPDKPAKPGTSYVWECGCTFVYACGGWRTRRVCQRHSHLADDPRQVMVAREEAGREC